MSKETRFGTFDELLEEASPEMQVIALALKKAILAVHPDAHEVVRLGDRAATYGVGPKKNTEAHTYIMPQKKHVNLGFFYGALLPDPEGNMEGTGKKMRHVKVRSLDQAGSPAIRSLIQQALEERIRALAG